MNRHSELTGAAPFLGMCLGTSEIDSDARIHFNVEGFVVRIQPPPLQCLCHPSQECMIVVEWKFMDRTNFLIKPYCFISLKQ